MAIGIDHVLIGENAIGDDEIVYQGLQIRHGWLRNF